MNGRLNIMLGTTLAMVVAGGCAKEEPAPTGGPPTSSADEVAIPTQEEADAKAAEMINESNADAELDKLQKEIDAEAGGG